MWKGSSTDPPGGPDGGGPSKNPSTSQELTDLKDQNEQQQVLIAQLKEMLRKSEQTVTQEKVDEYANTLNKMNAMAKNSKLRRSGEGFENKTFSESKRTLDTPAKEKINMIRQQMEENKAKFAERGKMVTQLKAQLDDSQQLINQSLNESKSEIYTANSTSDELFNIILIKEKRINELTLKVQKLEANVLDLQENVKEKDQVIDARTKAITLMSENLSRKGKNTLDALDDTKEQMRKMQENFIALEIEMKKEKEKLIEQLLHKNVEIENLKETNESLERNKLELNINISELQSKLEHESNLVEKYKNDLSNYEIKLLDLNKREDNDLEDYKKQIEILNNRIKELEETKSPQKTNKKGKKNIKQSKSKESIDEPDYTNEIETLQKLLQETKFNNNELNVKITQFENKIHELNCTIAELQTNKLVTEDNDEIIKLKKQLDENNKNMIKAKAQHKSKIKELNKKIDAFKSISDTNAEILRLQTENAKLNHKIAELEEEKGNLQLKIVESDSATEVSNEEHVKKLESEIKNFGDVLKEKNVVIESLEKQIEKSQNEIEILTEKLSSLSHLHSTQVTTEITSIHLEEQMDKLESENKQILEDKESLVKENDTLKDLNEQLKKEKQEITAKLDTYVQENIELIDKLEKLSAEKVSSAESIEIVEGLTQQEKMELEAYQKSIDLITSNIKNSDENLEQNQELNESVNQLTEETSELLQRIELFTVERREVMEKMEILTTENNNLNSKIKEIENNRDMLAETYEQLQNEKETLDKKLENIEEEKIELEKTLNYLDAENVELKQKIASGVGNEIFENELSEAKIKLTKYEDELNNYEEILRQNQEDFDNQKLNYESELNNLRLIVNNQKIESDSKVIAEFEELKQMLADNVAELQTYQREVDGNSKTIANLSEELNNLNKNLLESEHLIESKNDEIKKLIKEKENKEIIISNLQEEIKHNGENFHKVCNNLKEKCFSLQNQIEQNTGSLADIKNPLENKIQELTIKNKEQLDKMKKLAANLKKKTQSYQELEEKYQQINEKWENESKEKQTVIETQQLKLSEFEEKIKSLLEQLQEVELELANVQNEFKIKLEQHQSLLEEFNSFKNQTSDVEELKLRNNELEAQIKAFVNDNEQLHINLYETSRSVSSLNEEIESLQKTSEKNTSALQLRIQELETFIETQDQNLSAYKEQVINLEKNLVDVEQQKITLQQSLNGIEKQLQTVMEDNKNLMENNCSIKKTNEELKQKIESDSASLIEMREDNVKISHENIELNQIVGELKRKLADYEIKLLNRNEELDKLDSDMQEQLIQLTQERKNLLAQNEMLTDQLNEITNRNETLNEEIMQYKEKLQAMHAQNQTIESLQSQLEEKNYEIESYRKQNLEEVKRQHQISEKQLPTSELDTIKTVESKTETISTFVWPTSDSASPFDFIVNEEVVTSKKEPEQQAINTSNSNEELLKKIKTLEFMLYSVEKEKDEALLQCHGLTNELTRLVYERENVKNPSSDSTQTQLESQIVEGAACELTEDDQNQLRHLEFGEIKPTVKRETNEAVMEDLIQPQQTYLCYNPEELKTQIVEEAACELTEEDKKQLHHLEFVETKPVVKKETNEPVMEDLIQPQPTYLCYNPEEPVAKSSAQNDLHTINLDSFGENDDGWCWGPEEAKLEEAHREQNLQLLTEQLDEKIRVLELERERHLEEIRQAQVKSGKLIKKFKELKARNEQLETQLRTSSNEFTNLDDAIQDELKSQIEILEKKLKETNGELEKEKVDKDRLTKKIDVLTNANERMIEMKEKQDFEVLYWQQQNRELKTKFEQMEWGNDNPPVIQQPSELIIETNSENNQLKIEELNKTINDLILDNEELQAMLEDQRNNRIDLEKTKTNETDYLRLKNEYDNLNQQFIKQKEEAQHYQNEFNILNNKNTEMLQEINNLKHLLDNLNTEKNNLNDKLLNLQGLNENINNFDELKVIIKNLEDEKIKLTDLLQNTQANYEQLIVENNQIAEREKELINIREEKNILFEELQEKNIQLNNLKTTLESVINENRTLSENCLTKDSQIQEINMQIINLKTDLKNLKIQNENLETKEKEFELKLSTTIEELAQEWVVRVDQRGSDVAESWKLHLESRETEFMHLEQQLRKQINEMEEKCNTLVNENNELRKNVDAEIRNEVDRVSALQQQIYDKQQCINELSKNMQEKQEDFNKLQEEVQQSNDKILDIEKQLNEKTIEHSKCASIIAALEATIQEYTIKMQEYSELNNNLQQQVNKSEINILQLSEQLQLLQQQNVNLESLQIEINSYQQQLQQKQFDLDQLNESLKKYEELNETLQTKENDIEHLKGLIEEKEREFNCNMELRMQENKNIINEQIKELDDGRRRLTEIESHYEELLLAKDADLENIRLQLEQQIEKSDMVFNSNEEQYQNIRMQLEYKTIECNDLQEKLNELNALQIEENKQLSELRNIIEDQVLKIEELKKEAYEKSKNYDALVAQLDIPQTNEVSVVKQPTATEEDLSEPVSRAELDLALYMLHQRDVRCEELTVELMQLLEERDTLQLRLSNAIREKEEIKNKHEPPISIGDSIDSSKGAKPKSKASAIMLDASGTELATEAIEGVQTDPVANKISELKTVGYRKDKTLVDNQELRRMQELSIMQQHRDVAAKLPAEAAARLVDASYTLSRDVQSPSKVLLNWLWGRNIPKVNNV